MKRICIYVALGVLGAFSAHAQEINIGQTVARKISDDKVEVSFNMDCSTLRLPFTPTDGNHSLDNQPVGKRYARPAFSLHCRQKPLSHEQAERNVCMAEATGCGRGQEMIRFNRKRICC